MSKLVNKVKTFFAGTSEELRREFSDKNKLYGWLSYVAEINVIAGPIFDFFSDGRLNSFYSIPLGLIAADGVFRMSRGVISALKDGSLFKPDYRDYFDTPGIIGSLRELRESRNYTIFPKVNQKHL